MLLSLIFVCSLLFEVYRVKVNTSLKKVVLALLPEL